MIGEPLRIELLHTLIPGSVLPEAVQLFQIILEAVQIMHKHALACLLEPVGVRVIGRGFQDNSPTDLFLRATSKGFSC